MTIRGSGSDERRGRRRAPALGSRFRENDDGGVRCGGGCWWREALRQAQGERNCEARVRRGVGDAMGDGDAPRRAPLDSCLRRNDARGGVRAGGGCRWWEALRQAQGERIRSVGVRRGGGVRAAEGRGLLFGQGDPAGAEELGVVFPAAGDFSYLVSEDGAFREG